MVPIQVVLKNISTKPKKDKLPTLSDKRKIELLSSDGMLIKKTTINNR